LSCDTYPVETTVRSPNRPEIKLRWQLHIQQLFYVGWKRQDLMVADLFNVSGLQSEILLA
jgi:hypothetical protein